MRWVFIVFLLFFVSLFFHDLRLPKCCISMVTDRLSSTNLVVSCESASYGFRHGLTLKTVSAHDLSRENRLDPVLQAKSVNVDFSARELHVVGARYLRLPDSYYSSECRERNTPLVFEFPKLRDFHLVLERPEVLGVRPERLSTQVAVRPRSLTFDDIHAEIAASGGHWHAVDGRWRVDLNTQKVTGEVHGQVPQAQVRSLLESLDIVSSLPYIDNFTGLSGPVLGRGDFEIDLARGDFGMDLDLGLKTPSYRGVPFQMAEGSLGVQTGVRGTNCNVCLTVDLSEAVDLEGRSLSGRLGVTYTNGVTRLSYDVRSELEFKDILAVAAFLTPEDLGMIECHTAPVVTVKGTSGTSVEDLGHNDLSFEACVKRGSFLGFKLNDAVTRFTLKGDTFEFQEATAVGRTGGRLSAPSVLRLPGFDGARAEFASKITYEGGSLEEMADFFKFDLGERSGRVDGWCELEGPATTNFASRLNGGGHVSVTDGHLGQMKMFAGLTSLLADKVPGVGFLVNQSQASADFSISNGVFRSDNIYIEGGLVSLKGWGSYDIPRDNLDFTVRVRFLKEESLMGKILHPVTFPFTKLLLEFKATGPIDAPKWKYITIIDRIL